VAEKASGEKPLKNLRTVFGRRKPPIFVTSAIVLLLLAEKPMHGYALFKEMCEMGVYDDTLETSAIYPTLNLLEAEGLVTSELVHGGSGPPRKVLYITDDGLQTLEDLVGAFGDFEYLLNRYDAMKKKGKKGKTGSR
jgi:DNA-binding PadR family transcriptional regulator